MKYVVFLVVLVLILALVVACSPVKEVPVGEGGPTGGKVSLAIKGPVDENVSNENFQINDDLEELLVQEDE
jgi:hypothetical protein